MHHHHGCEPALAGGSQFGSTELGHDEKLVCAPIRGGVATLRPLRSGETEPLVAVFDAMSPGSRTGRFLHPVSSLSPSMLRSLSAVGGVGRAAWVAVVDGRPAGIGRYAAVAPGVAEIAFEVVDAHQGKGLGAVLLDVISTLARSAGFDRLQALTLGSNAASAHLLRQMGLPMTAANGVLEAEGPFRLLDPPRVDRAAVVELGGLSGHDRRVTSQPRAISQMTTSTATHPASAGRLRRWGSRRGRDRRRARRAGG